METLRGQFLYLKMNEDDQETYYRNERDANDALELCKKVVKDQQLDMRHLLHQLHVMETLRGQFLYLF
jgi:cell fate regulator YaaT (PSP1 superfamily)